MANLAARDSFFNDLFDFRRDLNGVFSRLVTGAPPVSERAFKMIAAVPPIEAWVDKNEKNTTCRLLWQVWIQRMFSSAFRGTISW